MKNNLLFKLTKLTLISSLLFFACSTKASADVNMEVLNYVIKSCQKNPPKDNSLFEIRPRYKTDDNCVESRYFYVGFMSINNQLKNLGDLRKGFPISIMIASFARGGASSNQFMDCMASNNSNSSDCNSLMFNLRTSEGPVIESFTPQICSSCFEAYINIEKQMTDIMVDIKSAMVRDLGIWFYKQSKSNRKLVVNSLSNKNFLEALSYESREAGRLYLKLKDKVQRETQEQKRRDLLN